MVSGAGPAGAMAADRCARAGLRTVMVEREEIPRSKCCAGGVLERSLRQLGVSLPDAVIEREIFGTALVHGDVRSEYRSPSRVAVTVKRERFDEFLVRMAEKAGAELIIGFRSRRVWEDSDKAVVESERGTALVARYLIIAEGANSSSARQVLGPYPRDGLAMGLAAECAFGRKPSDLIEFHLLDEDGFKMPFVTPGGIDGWMFPHKQGGNVGVGGYKARTEDLRRQLGRAIEEAGRSNDGAEVQGKIRAHSIPVKPRDRLSSSRCLVVGDAAGLASPMTGEGISYSLTSGSLAAATIQRVAALGYRSGCLTEYDRAVRTEILPILRAARWFSSGFQHLSKIVSIDRMILNMEEDRDLVDTIMAMSRAEKEWTCLLRKALVRFPAYFFSSVG